MNPEYDIIIPIKKEDINTFLCNVNYIEEHLQYRNIIIITNNISDDGKKNTINENTLFPGLTYNTVENLLKKRGGNTKRTGWYFQQFIKMAYAYVCKDEYYLLWDADLVPINDISLFASDGKPYFTLKKEYHKPYFNTINVLFDGSIEKQVDNSYISEHMIIKREYMKSMIEAIEDNEKIPGCAFYEKIINAISENDINNSGYSEFETYGNYVDKNYPRTYEHRRLRTCRLGNTLINVKDENSMKWVRRDYDIIAFEKSMAKSIFVKLLINDFTRKRFTFKSIYHLYRKHLIKYDVLFLRVINKIMKVERK